MQMPATDLSFDAHNERQLYETGAEQLRSRSLFLEPAGHYRKNGHGWEALPYPGFAVVSMMDQHPENEAATSILISVRDALRSINFLAEILYLLPVSSFHQTIANALSEGRYIGHIHTPGLEKQYPVMVEETFGRIGPAVPPGTPPLEMRLVGLSIFGTAIGALGIFDNKEAYQRILHFREGFYGDPAMAALGVQRTRPFIGHVTLGYVEGVLSPQEREQLVLAADQLNRQFFSGRPRFLMSRAELRCYEDLSAFKREERFPAFKL